MAQVKSSLRLAFYSALVVCIFSSLGLAGRALGDETPSLSWSRGTFSHSVEGSTQQKLMLWLVKQDSRLVGRFAYSQPSVEGPQSKPMPGVKAADGTFWPDATLLIQNERTAAWEAIVAPRIEGDRANVTVNAGEPNFGLHILLDPFKPFIGKAKFGRVVLKNGEISTFYLEDLEEPKASRTK